MESKQLNDLETPPKISTANIMTSVAEYKIKVSDSKIQEKQVPPPEDENMIDEIGYNIIYSENLLN